MENYILKLNSGTEYKLYKGTTLVSDADLTTLFGAAGEMYLSFDFNSGTPTSLTTFTITDSSDNAVISNSNLTDTIAEGKNYKATWSASATTFDTFEELEGKALDESQLSFLMGKIKNAGGDSAIKVIRVTDNDLVNRVYTFTEEASSAEPVKYYFVYSNDCTVTWDIKMGNSGPTSSSAQWSNSFYNHAYLIKLTYSNYTGRTAFDVFLDMNMSGKVWHGSTSSTSSTSFTYDPQEYVDNTTTNVATGTYSSPFAVLDARQGKVLADRIGDLTTLTTTAKTSTVAAINEVNSNLNDAALIGSTLSTPSSVAYVATDNIQDGAVTPAKISAATYQLDTEQVVGTWVNGKPLYRKVINFGALPNNTTKTVQIAGGSRVEVVDVHLSVHTDPDGGFATYAPVLPYYSTSNSIISASFSEYVVNVTSNGNSSSFSAYVYVYYWKKTD